MATTFEDYGDYSFMRTQSNAARRGGGAQKKSAKDGVLAKLFASFVASREAWAKDTVDAHLTTLSDRELVGLGLSKEQIADVRANVRARQVNWL